MATKYGIELRKIRLIRGENLQDMSEKAEISMSYMSAIENGMRKIPKDLTKKIIKIYDLNDEETKKLKDAELKSLDAISIDLSILTNDQKELAMLLSRKLPKAKTTEELIKMIT